MRKWLPFLILSLALIAAGRGEHTRKTSAEVRAERRLYDGAPPVIPHRPLGADCTACHALDGIDDAIVRGWKAAYGPDFTATDPHVFVPSFDPISAATCVECHHRDGVGIGCTTCHAYHATR